MSASKPAIVEQISVRPGTYAGALANPLCGFSTGDIQQHEWATLDRTYIQWNAIENSEKDDIDQIRQYCDVRWQGVEASGVRVIPRVYLNWPPDMNYWPDDMKTGDFSSQQFEARVLRLIERLGKLWDNDPRVAFIQMGIIGKWGEQHSPGPSLRMQKLLGDAFNKAFKTKRIQVRYPSDFRDFTFGYYWDSWAHPDDLASTGAGLLKLGDRWKTAVLGGETAYDWGNFRQLGDNPTDSVKDPQHRKYLIDSIRTYHNTYLGWVSSYDQSDPDARAGAAQMQASMGYRFQIDAARYPSRVDPGHPFKLSFDVRNLGSAPMYYDWPVGVALLDRKTGRPVWSARLKGPRVSAWMPGDKWSKDSGAYLVPPAVYTVSEEFELPASVKPGEYLIAVSIIDPWSRPAVPAIRFANSDCTADGRLPLGTIGIGVNRKGVAIPRELLVDPGSLRPQYFI